MTLALLVGLAVSTGLGYAPVGPMAELVIHAPHVEARTLVDLTHKRATDAGWNARQELRVHVSRLIIGGQVQAWSGGPWTKHSVGVVMGWRVAPDAAIILARTVRSSYGESSSSAGVEIDIGRVRPTIRVIRFQQPPRSPRYGVSAGMEVRLWRN